MADKIHIKEIFLVQNLKQYPAGPRYDIGPVQMHVDTSTSVMVELHAKKSSWKDLLTLGMYVKFKVQI